MRRTSLALVIGLAPVPALADYAVFQECVATAEDPVAARATCAQSLAAPCGQAETAQAAAACMDARRDTLSTGTLARLDMLKESLSEAERTALTQEVVDSDLRGQAACRAMAIRDEQTGVADGQRMVNDAFCQLISAGDTAGMLLDLEANR